MSPPCSSWTLRPIPGKCVMTSKDSEIQTTPRYQGFQEVPMGSTPLCEEIYKKRARGRDQTYKMSDTWHPNDGRHPSALPGIHNVFPNFMVSVAWHGHWVRKEKGKRLTVKDPRIRKRWCTRAAEGRCGPGSSGLRLAPRRYSMRPLAHRCH